METSVSVIIRERKDGEQSPGAMFADACWTAAVRAARAHGFSAELATSEFRLLVEGIQGAEVLERLGTRTLDAQLNRALHFLERLFAECGRTKNEYAISVFLAVGMADGMRLCVLPAATVRKLADMKAIVMICPMVSGRAGSFLDDQRPN